MNDLMLAKREDLISYISDEYKSLHGIRPRWLKLDTLPLNALETLANEIEAGIVAEIARVDLKRAELYAAILNPNAIVFFYGTTAEELEFLNRCKRHGTYFVEDHYGFYINPRPTPNTVMAEAFAK